MNEPRIPLYPVRLSRIGEGGAIARRAVVFREDGGSGDGEWKCLRSTA